MKNVVVLGGSYGGATAVNRLAQTLPKGYRVILIERNTHANHLYVFPRLSVLPGHEHKAFIPYTHIFDPIPLIANDTSPSSSSNNSSNNSSSSNSPDSSRPASPTSPSEPPQPEPYRHLFLHAHVTGLTPHSVKLDRAFPEYGFDTPEVPFEYAVYALGSRLPGPIDVWARAGVAEGAEAVDANADAGAAEKEESGNKTDGDEDVDAGTDANANGELVQTQESEKPEPEVGVVPAPAGYTGSKREATQWMQRCQERIKSVRSVLVVGGGALGIQYATDIASLYPDKRVTLLHSRNRLLPRYNPEMHSEIMKAMTDLGITIILDERLDLSTVTHPGTKGAERVVRTLKGREISAELIMLCTGQTPNTAILREMDERLVRPDTGLACVLRTMQVGWCGQEGDWAVEPEPVGEEEAVVPQVEDRAGEEGEDQEGEDHVGDGTSEVIEGGAKTTLEVSEPEPEHSASSSSPTQEVQEADTETSPTSTTSSSPTSSSSPSTTSTPATTSAPLPAPTPAPTPKPYYRSPYPHIFIVGDAADAFGAIKAGHVAFYQAQVVVANIGKMIAAREAREKGAANGEAGEGEIKEKVIEEEEVELDWYEPTPPAIKVSLGLTRPAVYEIAGQIGLKDGADDLDAGLMWPYFGFYNPTKEDMYL